MVRCASRPAPSGRDAGLASSVERWSPRLCLRELEPARAQRPRSAPAAKRASRGTASIRPLPAAGTLDWPPACGDGDSRICPQVGSNRRVPSATAVPRPRKSEPGHGRNDRRPSSCENLNCQLSNMHIDDGYTREATLAQDTPDELWIAYRPMLARDR